MAQSSNYQMLSEELEGIVVKLQQPGIKVDDAAALYEQGLKLVKQCEAQLRLAENKITKLKLQSGGRTSKAGE